MIFIRISKIPLKVLKNVLKFKVFRRVCLLNLNSICIMIKFISFYSIVTLSYDLFKLPESSYLKLQMQKTLVIVEILQVPVELFILVQDSVTIYP